MIHGKVVRILSHEEVILNVGQQDNVNAGMEFVIYTESDHIIDPDTKEDLGAIEFVKGRLIITHVMPKMSRASTKSISTDLAQAMNNSLAATLFTRSQKTYLKVAQDQVKPLPAAEDEVRVGDLVRSIRDTQG